MGGRAPCPVAICGFVSRLKDTLSGIAFDRTHAMDMGRTSSPACRCGANGGRAHRSELYGHCNEVNISYALNCLNEVGKSLTHLGTWMLLRCVLWDLNWSSKGWTNVRMNLDKVSENY